MRLTNSRLEIPVVIFALSVIPIILFGFNIAGKNTRSLQLADELFSPLILFSFVPIQTGGISPMPERQLGYRLFYTGNWSI